MIHIPHTDSYYSLAQLLGSYDTYTPYTQHLLFGPVTGLTSDIYYTETIATTQLIG